MYWAIPCLSCAPEYEENDLMHVAFVTANIQTVTGAIEMIEKADTVKE